MHSENSGGARERENMRHSRHSDQSILDYIIAYKQANDGNSPTVREIAMAFAASTSVIGYHLRRMRLSGEIYTTSYGMSRNLCVTGGRWAIYADKAAPGGDRE